MTVFTIYYDKETGLIKSYQDGGDTPPENEIPKGCERIMFNHRPDIFDASSFLLKAKVDPEKRQLVFLSQPMPVVEETKTVVEAQSPSHLRN
jgi:hypothetical protein